MVRIGIWAPRSRMKSNPPLPTSGSRQRAQNSRTFGSSALILRGVKRRVSRLRCMSCVGGSSKMKMPGGNCMPLLIISSTVPRAELYFSHSIEQRSTSAKRLSAWKP